MNNYMKKTLIRKNAINQYHLVLPIEYKFKASLGETTEYIKLAIYSLHSMVEKLNIRSLSIAKSP